jgi:hypothetical protein
MTHISVQDVVDDLAIRFAISFSGAPAGLSEHLKIHRVSDVMPLVVLDASVSS